MKKLLILLALVGFTSLSYSQELIQTYTDRCTGATQVFSIPLTGSTVVVFYNRSQTFTAADVQSGAFQAWLEETYAWWSALNPCSTAQAESTTAQQTTQQTTQAATAAASSAASAAPPTAPDTSSTTNTGSTNATSNTTSSTSNTDNSSSSSSSSTDASGGGESSSDSSGGSGEGTTSDSESKQEETKTEETSSEESKSEESSEEEVSEESSEEESSEEESSEEESEEESSDESESEEEEEKKEKKKNLAPPILAANIMSMQMLDGTWSTAASFGVSQSSLTGQETYSANAMIWTNFKQFSLALSKSKVHFWRDRLTYSEVISSTGSRRVTQGSKDKENQIHHVGTTSVNYMNIFGTNVITTGYSRVLLGQNENFWKGFAGGYATTGSFIILPESTLFSPAFTFFGTKPVKFKSLPRWGFGPMVAVSLTPIQLSYQDSKINVVWNEYFNYIIGTNVNFNLTQRFVANLGINTINNTNPIIPTTFALTIGARFAF